MIDLHYDFLTDIYVKLKDGNEEAIKKFCKETYRNDNINGGILNMYFMLKEEMLEELGIEEHEIDVLSMMRTVTSFISQNNLFGDNSNFVFGIEGCDYLNRVDDLEILYEMGLRAIIPVWNNPNKFGSGICSDIGLTDLGKELINKAIDLGIGIDLSHANENTFWDIIKVIRERIRSGDEPIVYASHSNVMSLCDRGRNLNDNQILAVKEVNGVIGLMSHRDFVKLDNKGFSLTKMEDYFVDHIKYVSNLLGGIDNIAMSTDDMNFDPDTSLHGSNIYSMKSINHDLRGTLLRHGYSEEDIEKIMNKNGMKIISRLKGWN